MSKIGGNKTFGAPFERFNIGGYQTMQFRDSDHSPFAGSKADRSSLMFEVSRMMPTGQGEHPVCSAPWIEFGMHETGHFANGKQTTRAITTSIPMAEALKIAKFILEAAALNHNEAVRDEVYEIINGIGR